MPEPSSPAVLSPPDLSWRADGQPVSEQFNDPYFSVDNGLEESRYVFLQHNGLPQRWQDWPWTQQPAFCIVETGFGTGLNFLLTWDSWLKRGHNDGWLHFTSVEKYPLTREQLQQALALWPGLQALSERLQQQWPLPLRGAHHLHWPEERISLTLWFDDVASALPQLSGPVHAWYLDGFAPARNPDMWNDDLFAAMRRLSQRQPQQYDGSVSATIATFTAAGLVRRGLLGAGFSVKRVPGYGRKREMLAGVFNRRCGPEQPPHHLHKPWLLPTNSPAGQPSVLPRVAVIGAGLAGACTARALAERGCQVSVLDPAGIANGASGNPQGGLYIKLAAGDDAMHTAFYLAAYQYALPFMQRYLGPGTADNPYWQQCGVLQLAYDDKEASRQQKFTTSQTLPAELVHPVDAAQASALAGCPQPQGGLFFPSAGWVSPADLCRQLLQHPAISVIEQAVTQLLPVTGAAQPGWQVHTCTAALTADQVVVATAYEATALLPQAYLPLKRIRGQLSYLDAAQTPMLNTVLCGRSYLPPPRDGRQCLGATYNLRDDDPTLREQDHLTNVQHLADFGPAWAELAGAAGMHAVIGGRVGFRCTAPDYLPLVGAVPVAKEFATTFAPLVRNAKKIPPLTAPQLPGLWLNVGHGSRGLASAPLCGEMLAAMICNDALPVGNEMAEALWPGRFLLRDMVRRKLPPQVD